MKKEVEVTLKITDKLDIIERAFFKASRTESTCGDFLPNS